MEGAMEGKRERGRPRRRWAQDVSDWMGQDVTEGGKIAQEDRDKFRAAVWEATSARDAPRR